MTFKGQPNLYVKINNKIVQRASGIKGFYFDENGLYSTENELLIKVLGQNFEAVKEEIDTVIMEPKASVEVSMYKCKHCDYETANKGELLAHYREHKKV